MQTPGQRQMIALRNLIIAEIENIRRGDELSGEQANADSAFSELCDAFGIDEPEA